MATATNRIQRCFNKGCVDYRLLEEDDRILVAVSGGKDSLMLLRLLAARARIFKPHIVVEAAHVVMENIPYHTDLDYLQSFCADLAVPLHILHASFEENSKPITDKKNGQQTEPKVARRQHTACFLCAWNRRKRLFTFAQEHGFNKVALGHHMDDILTTLLMNITFEGSFQTMPPRLTLEHYPLTLIRPLCLVREEDISAVADTLQFRPQTQTCPFEDASRRTAMASVFHQLESLNPEARYSLWQSMTNIKKDYLA